MTTKTADTVLDGLVCVRETLEDPKHWTKGTLQSGDRYCLIGAVQKCDGPAQRKVTDAIKETLTRQADGNKHYGNDSSVMGWNDTKSRTHGEVIAMLDRAIQWQACR